MVAVHGDEGGWARFGGGGCPGEGVDAIYDELGEGGFAGAWDAADCDDWRIRFSASVAVTGFHCTVDDVDGGEGGRERGGEENLT